MKKKYCGRCKKDQPLDNFHKDSYRPDGLCTRCKTCKSELAVITKEKKKAETALLKKHKVPKSKIECLRGGVIFKKECIPGCNDVCRGCKNPQLNNIKASDDTLTAEEEAIEKHEGIRGSYGVMLEGAIW